MPRFDAASAFRRGAEIVSAIYHGATLIWSPAAAPTGPAIGAHRLLGQEDGDGVSPAVTPAITTQPTGSSFVVFDAGYTVDSAIPTDTYSNDLVQQGTSSEWDGFGGFVMRAWVIEDGAGGAGHQFSKVKSTFPDGEFTMGFAEAKGCTRLVDFKQDYAHYPDVATHTAVHLDGPGVIIALWSGDAQGTGDFHNNTVTVDNGFEVLDQYGVWPDGGTGIECAMAAREVDAAGDYTVTWTDTPHQGANLFIFAFEPAVEAPPLSLGNHTQKGFDGITSATTDAIDTISGGTLYACTTQAGGSGGVQTATGITDNYGNTWTEIGTGNMNRCGLRWWRADNAIGGTAHTITITYSEIDYPVVSFGQFLGTTLDALDAIGTAVDSTGPYDVVTSSATTVANALVLTAIASSDVTTYAADGYTIIDQTPDAGSFWPGAVAYKIVSVTGVQSASWTTGGDSQSAVKIAAFKGAAGPQPMGLSGTLPGGVVGDDYDAGLTLTGNVTPPVAWDLAAGAEPSGTTINATTGRVGGALDTAETAALTIRATDSSTPPQVATSAQTVEVTATAPYPLIDEVVPGGGSAHTCVFTLASAPPVGTYLVAVLSVSQFGGSRTVPAPDANWTPWSHGLVVQGTSATIAFIREVQAGDGTAYTFTATGGSEWQNGVMYRVSNWDGTLTGAQFAKGTAWPITVTVPAEAGDALAIGWAACDYGTANSEGVPTATGWTPDANRTPAYHLCAAMHQISVAGVATVMTATSSPNNATVCGVILLGHA